MVVKNATGGDSFETQMLSKFLAMPSLFEPELQSYLLKEYTPAKSVSVCTFVATCYAYVPAWLRDMRVCLRGYVCDMRGCCLLCVCASACRCGSVCIPLSPVVACGWHRFDMLLTMVSCICLIVQAHHEPSVDSIDTASPVTRSQRRDSSMSATSDGGPHSPQLSVAEENTNVTRLVRWGVSCVLLHTVAHHNAFPSWACKVANLLFSDAVIVRVVCN